MAGMRQSLPVFGSCHPTRCRPDVKKRKKNNQPTIPTSNLTGRSCHSAVRSSTDNRCPESGDRKVWLSSGASTLTLQFHYGFSPPREEWICWVG
ncbi:hypothetical protein BDQ94DRAFT_50705 [Aspergillus welwitschiae]|uniref:Uncharacterized protein n=1 Tax=Aspergillus welwitschiae TaxID=1341132 RepID=A0A3F3PZ25_9EURO|nr:hypothetical protein BDQ94DRAFT_50705 [Aspergillus welwitschiae]RDH32200.1 hypothetical protein BDQ94DRAFT_50705 [Aspergillus welwitschiae]